MLYRQFKGEEEDSTDQSEDKEGGIAVSRLEELLEKCDGDDATVELNEEEKEAFGEFVQKHAASAVTLWDPWWNSRKEFATVKVEDMASQESASDFNMNRFGEDPEDGQEGDDEGDDGDFEDIEEEEEEELDKSNDLSEAALEQLYHRRLKAVPELGSLLKSKAPAETLPFLMASNVISFLFYSRYYNGSLLDADPLRLTANLTAQLLSKESQKHIEVDFSSAYIDAMKAIAHIGRLDASQIAEL